MIVVKLFQIVIPNRRLLSNYHIIDPHPANNQPPTTKKTHKMANYLISRFASPSAQPTRAANTVDASVADPIFALFIGASAATIRIRREEAEAGRTPTQALEALKRRVSWYFS